jgi:hypothetical protein
MFLKKKIKEKGKHVKEEEPVIVEDKHCHENEERP